MIFGAGADWLMIIVVVLDSIVGTYLLFRILLVFLFLAGGGGWCIGCIREERHIEILIVH